MPQGELAGVTRAGGSVAFFSRHSRSFWEMTSAQDTRSGSHAGTLSELQCGQVASATGNVENSTSACLWQTGHPRGSPSGVHEEMTAIGGPAGQSGSFLSFSLSFSLS